MPLDNLATIKLLDEIQSLLYYESDSWPLRCSLSSYSVNRINEITKQIKEEILLK